MNNEKTEATEGSESELSALLCMTPDVENIADYLANYWGTYIKMQPSARNYTSETVINDALYGLGAALSDDYRFAQGFDKFKKDLLVYLTA